MEVFSLEDEDYGDLFITQEPKKIVDLSPHFEDNVDKSDEVDLNEKQAGEPEFHYSDISEEESFQIGNDNGKKQDER